MKGSELSSVRQRKRSSYVKRKGVRSRSLDRSSLELWNL